MDEESEYDKLFINPDDIRQLVLSYLIHFGFKKTAIEFMKQNNWLLESTKHITDQKIEKNNLLLKNIDERKRSYELLNSGKTLEAIEYVKEKFLNVLDSDDNVKYGLLSLRFVDLVRDKKRQEALKFAQEHISPIAKRNNKFMEPLKDMLALLCYEKPEDSPVGYLMKKEYREEIANMLNSAILVSQKLPASPAVERMLCHLVVLRDQLHVESGQVCFSISQKLTEEENSKVEFTSIFEKGLIVYCYVNSNNLSGFGGIFFFEIDCNNHSNTFL